MFNNFKSLSNDTVCLKLNVSFRKHFKKRYSHISSEDVSDNASFFRFRI